MSDADPTRTTASGSADALADEELRFPPGVVLAGRYRIAGRLGKGGMGEVYRAEDLKLRQAVALKFLPPSLAADPVRLSRLHDEVRLSRRVTHPNVCRVHDIVEADSQHFISMELVEGEDLVSLLRRIGRLPAHKAVEIGRQICAALSAAHERGILHRDLKPANIMLDSDGAVRITDFGLAVAAGESRPGEIAGTPAYMAPEQASGQGVSVQSEIYALGLVLYELFVGRRPFQAGSVEEMLKLHRDAVPPRPRELAADIDPRVEELILQCLEKPPERRPPSALAVSAALLGDDPLAALLAAGETPSPRLVAAAREPALAPQATLASILFILCAGIALLFLAPSLVLLNQVPLEHPPAVLEDRARSLLEELGYAGRPRGRASGFAYEEGFLGWVEAEVEAPRRWDALAGGRPAAIAYWYRQSPTVLQPRDALGRTAWDDPPLDRAGSVAVRLDTTGRLLELRATPPDGAPPEGEREPVWSALLAAAGFGDTELEPTDPSITPPVFATDRRAWSGRLSGHELRVEAATYGSRPVSFRLLGPWDRASAAPSGRSHGAGAAAAGAAPLKFLVLVMGLYFAWRNFQLGRWDREGSARLAGFAFVLGVTAWMLRIPQATSLARSWELLGYGFGRALYDGVVLGILYAAVEPALRRRSPRSLVSWRRLLGGRLGDPAVGRDVLLGMVLTQVVLLLFAFALALPGWLGGPGARPLAVDLEMLAGPARAMAAVVGAPGDAIFVGIVYLLMLVLLRSVLHREPAVLLAFLAIWSAGAVAVLGVRHPASVAVVAVAGLCTVFALSHFGLLVVVIQSFFLALRPPFTTELAAWYGRPALLGAVAMAALMIASARSALADQPLFQLQD